MIDGIYIDLRPPHPDDVAFMEIAEAVQEAWQLTQADPKS